MTVGHTATLDRSRIWVHHAISAVEFQLKFVRKLKNLYKHLILDELRSNSVLLNPQNRPWVSYRLRRRLSHRFETFFTYLSAYLATSI